MNIRSSGVLLHITSLPSRFGTGDLGPAAYDFADFLRSHGQLYWQFLPTTPTTGIMGNSPYASWSAFAGNPLLISPEMMVEDGIITWEDVRDAPQGHAAHVNYGAVEIYKAHLLRAAYARKKKSLSTCPRFSVFRENHAHWLHDYARFVTIMDEHPNMIWSQWPEPLKHRHDDALLQWDAEHRDAIEYEEYVQYLFFSQWRRLRAYCNRNGLNLIGDIPIYVTHHSADVWTSPHLFKLDSNGEPTHVGGVPPDYFSSTGQRWGNPVFNWDAMRQDNFEWWVRRMRHNIALVDKIRLDHFRGFAGYWEIPASETTAINGKWIDAPGMELFRIFTLRFGVLPIIAEDLGVITADVRELKQQFNLPGMKILQFGFGGDLTRNPDTPFHHEHHCVLYTGTHDNSTVKGWYVTEAGDQGRNNLHEFVGQCTDMDNVHLTFMRLAMQSVANTAIFPVQDIIGLDNSARMNTPSTANGNWEWRMTKEHLQHPMFTRLSQLTGLFGRWT